MSHCRCRYRYNWKPMDKRQILNRDGMDGIKRKVFFFLCTFLFIFTYIHLFDVLSVYFILISSAVVTFSSVLNLRSWHKYLNYYFLKRWVENINNNIMWLCEIKSIVLVVIRNCYFMFEYIYLLFLNFQHFYLNSRNDTYDEHVCSKWKFNIW